MQFFYKFEIASGKKKCLKNCPFVDGLTDSPIHTGFVEHQSGPISRAVSHTRRQAPGSHEASVLGGGDRVKEYTKNTRKCQVVIGATGKGNRVMRWRWG